MSGSRTEVDIVCRVWPGKATIVPFQDSDIAPEMSNRTCIFSCESASMVLDFGS